MKYRESFRNLVFTVLSYIVSYYVFASLFDFRKIAIYSSLVLFFISCIYTICTWISKKFYVENDLLQIEVGVFNKKITKIPLISITSIDITRTFKQRLLGVYTMNIYTKNQSEDIKLMLSSKIIQQLQRILLRNQNSTKIKAIYRMNKKEVLLFSLSYSTLVVNLSVILSLLVLGYNIGFEVILDTPMTQVIALLLFIILIKVLSCLWNLVKFYDFRIDQQEEIITVHSGLLNTQSGIINKERISAVHISQTPIFRLFNKATISISIIGVDEADEKINVIFPILPFNEVFGVIYTFFSEFDFVDEKKRISPTHKLIYNTTFYGMSNTMLYLSRGILVKRIAIIKLGEIDSIQIKKNIINQCKRTLCLRVNYAGMKFEDLKSINGIESNNFDNIFRKLF